MQKTFDIIIDDQQPVNPNNSFAIYRGDNVAFNFTFQRGGVALDVEGATLRVFAKKIQKNGQVDKLSNPLFSEDFIESNTATFNSDKTSGDAGNYILSVLLLSSEQAVITSQCIYFELKENGYAGYYQPSEDFRDAIFDASQNVIDAEANAKQYSESAESSKRNAYASEQSAKTSEVNAKASENTARALSQYAEQYSRNAEQSANDCAESVAIVQSTEGECLEAVANAEYYARQSQEASDKAIAITDPEGFRTSTSESIASLSEAVVGKSNRGEFWFNGGSLQNNTLKYSQGNPFSFAFGFRAKKSDILGVTTAIYIVNLGFLYLYLPADTKKIAFYSGGVFGGKYISDADNDRLLNGEWHSLVISYDGITLKLTDETGVLVSVSAILPSQSISSAIKIGNYLIGQMRSIKYFNFDMSSYDAPYTIADYISGKDESPLLKDNQPVVSYPTNVSGLSVVENKVVLTNTAKIQPKPFVAGTFKSGKTYKIRVQGTITGSKDDAQSLRIYLPTDKFTMYRTDVSTGEVDDVSAKTSVAFTIKPDGKEYIVDIEFVATADSTNSNTYMSIDPVDTSVENWFTMSAWTDGVLLSLDDYTFNGKVFDTSGNNNTATITGAVYGTRDNAVEQMYQAFASRIGNLTE